MIFEVEEKAYVNDVEAMREKLRAQFLEHGSEVKYDTYFRNDTTGRLVRMRESAKGLLVTTKDKQVPTGIDQEVELSINNKERFKEFMALLGFEEYFKKVKRVELYTDGIIQYELVHVDNLGDFIEVEILEEDESRVEEAHRRVCEALYELGYHENDLIKQSYRELLTKKTA
jgi:predicted adenylyl cyclase CyaB